MTYPVLFIRGIYKAVRQRNGNFLVKSFYDNIQMLYCEF